ncbi:11767_t:CDS:2, partial [Racocetra fulgida]
VYVIPQQGSSSSTSDGIVKVFDKANDYQKGSSDEFPLITVVLLDEIRPKFKQSDYIDTAKQLLEKNKLKTWNDIQDKNARHLMIIGKSDSIVNILTYKLRLWGKEFSEKNPKSDQINTWDLDPVIIYGSQFPDDFDGDYQYGILNRIM